jgi:ABC-type nitrate/sulfonate/bicarbonate transport system substrate-binding protein
MSKHIRLVSLVLFVFINSFVSADEHRKLTSVTLQLQWLHQFQFAGFYAAIDQGYYHEEGLEVVIKEGQTHPYHSIATGIADFGVASSGLIIEQAKSGNYVALGATFQTSPYVWLLPADSPIQSIDDFAGKTITSQSESDDLSALFALNEIDTSTINLVSPDHGVDSLINGDVDAIIAYVSNEPYSMIQRGEDFKTISLQDYDIDFYSDILFTSAAFLEKKS